MKRTRYLLLIFSFLSAGILSAQEQRAEFRTNFKVNVTKIDPGYENNADSVRKIISFLDSVKNDPAVTITEVSFKGSASPESWYEWNRYLAGERLKSLEKIIREEVEIPDSLITRDDSYIPWSDLKLMVLESDLPNKGEIISIIDEEPILVNYHRPNTRVDQRITRLKQLDGGKTWNELSHQYFSKMRYAYAVIHTFGEKPAPLPKLELRPMDIKLNTSIELPLMGLGSLPYSPKRPAKWTPRIYLKTNAVAWLMAISNIAGEIDIYKHWSFSLPLSYSAWDYFSCRVKFRTLSMYPELRYWFSETNDRFYAGIHFGLAYYNFAFHGTYRIQDHDGKTPAVGGELSVGNRLPLSKDNAWRMEFSLGAGVYSLDYDRFYNTRPTSAGLIHDRIKKTWFGVDQVSISIVRAFNLGKKGGGL